MPNLMPTDLVNSVRKVLLKARRGGDRLPSFLTAYQILTRLPPTIKARLIRERGLGGKGAGTRYAAASVVSDAAECVPGVVVAYLDVKEIGLSVEDSSIVPSPKVCGIFRLPGPQKK